VRAAGFFQLCDLNMENGRYSGVCRIQLPVPWTLLSGKTQRKLCSFQLQMEITKHSATRIEGRVENPTKTIQNWSYRDYKGCGERNSLEWKDLTWIRPD